MTHLRKMMLEELERRNYSQSTVRTYVKTIEDLARYFQAFPGSTRARSLASISGVFVPSMIDNDPPYGSSIDPTAVRRRLGG